jgi:hypothetical protein
VRFALRILAPALLAAGLIAGPTVAADASASVSVTFVDAYGSDTFTYSCSGAHTYYSEDISYVSNSCGYRVWLHSSAGGANPSYCINPGAIAYGFGGGFVQFLVTEQGAACDAGVESTVGWGNEVSYSTVESVTQAACVDGQTYTNYLYSSTGSSYLGVEDLPNKCNTRIWIHENADGSGPAFCVSPGATVTSLGSAYGVWSAEYGIGDQIQVSGNQAPCSAG